MITAIIPYMVLVMCTAHVYSSNILSGTHPKMIKMSHLCLDLMGKEACMARPAGGAVELDWLLLSPVKTQYGP